MNFLDPNTLQTADVNEDIYSRSPFLSLADAQDLVEFIVMDIEPTGQHKGKWLLAEATVARASDLGVNDKTYFVRTHLGHYLHAGDSAMGYMMTGANYNSAQLDAIENSSTYGSTIPDVVLVKKHYPNKRKNRRRNWKLKRMARDEGEMLPKKTDQERMDAEYELFLRDVEEDDELRAALALYKNSRKNKRPDLDAMSVAETEMTVDDDGPKIDMEELLDDLEELDIQDNEVEME